MTREELIASDGLELHLPCVILTAQICRTPVPSSRHAGNHTVCKSSAFKVHAIASCQTPLHSPGFRLDKLLGRIRFCVRALAACLLLTAANHLATIAKPSYVHGLSHFFRAPYQPSYTRCNTSLPPQRSDSVYGRKTDGLSAVRFELALSVIP